MRRSRRDILRVPRGKGQRAKELGLEYLRRTRMKKVRVVLLALVLAAGSTVVPTFAQGKAATAGQEKKGEAKGGEKKAPAGKAKGKAKKGGEKAGKEKK